MDKYADLHCDTFSECFNKKISLSDPSLQISMPSLAQYHSFIQTFAHYISEGIQEKWIYFNNMLQNSNMLLRQNNITLFTGQRDIPNRCAVFSVEGGDFFETPEQACIRLPFLKKNGFLLFSLIYNHTNRLGCGARSATDTGLTKLGREIAPVFGKFGIVIDISHASYQSARELIELSSLPVCATHSNCYSVTENGRNLPDDILHSIADSGGLVGLNFYPPFLNSSGKANLNDIVGHLQHMIDLCGVDHVALGCDFDGIRELPDGITGIASLPQIFLQLQRNGFSSYILEKVFYNNVYGFVQNIGR